MKSNGKINPKYLDKYKRLQKAAEAGRMDVLEEAVADAENKEGDYFAAFFTAAHLSGQGQVEAEHLLGMLQIMLHMDEKMGHLGTVMLKSAADKGYAPAQFDMAFAYLHGTQVEQSKEKAYAYFLAAAEQGLARAEFMVGMDNMVGFMVGKVDEEEGEKWLRRAVEHGFTLAMIELGKLCANKYNDDEECFQYFLQAGLAGQPLAYPILVKAYTDGIGVEANAKEAAKWRAKTRKGENVTFRFF